jgi:hypothetical protein
MDVKSLISRTGTADLCTLIESLESKSAGFAFISTYVRVNTVKKFRFSNAVISLIVYTWFHAHLTIIIQIY